MKFPATLLLNFDAPQHPSIRLYWISRCLLQSRIDANFTSKFIWVSKDAVKKSILHDPSKFTLVYPSLDYLSKRSDFEQTSCIKNKNIKSVFKKKVLHSESVDERFYDYLSYPNWSLNWRKFMFNTALLKKRNFEMKKLSSKALNRFDLIFLRKERIYTKLKYSRVPQYDAVSGGSAALLAGFLGFLITEKFGLELTDSGDFWFFFLYLAFFTFCFQPLMRMIMDATTDWSVFTWRWALDFYLTIGLLAIKKLKISFKKITRIFL